MPSATEVPRRRTGRMIETEQKCKPVFESVFGPLLRVAHQIFNRGHFSTTISRYLSETSDPSAVKTLAPFAPCFLLSTFCFSPDAQLQTSFVPSFRGGWKVSKVRTDAGTPTLSFAACPLSATASTSGPSSGKLALPPLRLRAQCLAPCRGRRPPLCQMLLPPPGNGPCPSHHRPHPQ